MSINEYIEQHSSPESELLHAINRETNLHILNAHMLSGHVQGRVLSLLSQMIAPKRILELGTFTGYSALCLAEGLQPDGQLITLEHNDELAELIQTHFDRSPYTNQIQLMIGDCKKIIPTLDGDFDLVFMDADKREYNAYMDLIYNRVRIGGWILADNTLWDGHIIDAAYDKDAQTLGLRAFNDRIAEDERFEKVILPLRDGLTIMRKKA